MNIKVALESDNSENKESFTNGLVRVNEGSNIRMDFRPSNGI